MPLCGFNEKMLKGLSDFNEGLIEYGLVFRGEKNDETIGQGIKREISDMARFIPEISKINDVPKRVITQGIVTYAMGFYMVMRAKELDKNSNEYKRFVQEIGNYFQKMDEKYYGEFENNFNDMELLSAFLNESNI
jgi:hypothetical protein